jgi:hypothetical protein
LECHVECEDLLTKNESGGPAKRSGDRIDVFVGSRRFLDFIQSSCLARVMVLSNQPMQRSPGQQQECFPYIDRAIRLHPILVAAAREPVLVQGHTHDQDHHQSSHWTDDECSDAQSNGEGLPAREADKAGGGKDSGGAVPGSVRLMGPASGPRFETASIGCL